MPYLIHCVQEYLANEADYSDFCYLPTPHDTTLVSNNNKAGYCAKK